MYAYTYAENNYVLNTLSSCVYTCMYVGCVDDLLIEAGVCGHERRCGCGSEAAQELHPGLAGLLCGQRLEQDDVAISSDRVVRSYRPCFVCMYVCMYIYVLVLIISLHMYVCMYVCMCVYVYLCTCSHNKPSKVCVCIYIEGKTCSLSMLNTIIVCMYVCMYNKPSKV